MHKQATLWGILLLLFFFAFVFFFCMSSSLFCGVLNTSFFISVACLRRYGFKLPTFERLLDTKSTDRQKTLLHYIAHLIQKKFVPFIFRRNRHVLPVFLLCPLSLFYFSILRSLACLVFLTFLFLFFLLPFSRFFFFFFFLLPQIPGDLDVSGGD